MVRNVGDLTQFDQVFSDPSVPRKLQQTAPTSLAAAARFWRTTLEGEHLSLRLKELILIALHASVTSLDAEAIKRHIGRALTAGASTEDVLDVLTSIVGVANHSLYSAVPVLMSELKAAGRDDEAELPLATPEAEAIKNDFIRSRGYWLESRNELLRLMPAYCGALSEVSIQPWKHGVLSPKDRELIYIAIDCSPTHTYAHGLAMHIRHALGHGATRDEILEIFQLAAMTGLEGFILGAEALFGSSSATAIEGEP